MAKQAYIGVDGMARKLKKGYVGIDGTARNLKKIYIGIGGVARLCWAGGELAYYGTVPSLSAAKLEVASATIGDRLLAAGGAYAMAPQYAQYATVDVYDAALVKTTAASLSAAVYRAEGATLNQTYALFAGGFQASAQAPRAAVEAYDYALTKTAATALSVSRCCLCGVSAGTGVVFAAGASGSEGSYVTAKTVNAYHSDLTRSTLGDLPVAGYYNGGTVGSYGVMSCQSGTSSVAYQADLTQLTLTGAQHGGKGCPAGKILVFANESTAYAYTEELTQVMLEPFAKKQQANIWTGAAGVADFAVYAGGFDANDTVIAYADAYQETTHILLPGLATARSWHFGGTVGNYVLFGGGCGNGTFSSVEAYTIV